MALRMIVEDVFNFADGRTVLVGPVEGHRFLIESGRYGLYKDGVLVQEVDIEDEMRPRVTDEVRTNRVVSINKRIGLQSGPPKNSLVLASLSKSEAGRSELVAANPGA